MRSGRGWRRCHILVTHGRKCRYTVLRNGQALALAYIENGGDLFSLQRILGHTTQTMTSRYINMAKRSVKAQHEKFSIGNVL